MALYRLMVRDRHGLRVGKHSMGPVENGVFSRVVKPGEIIESEQPLDELFRNKFERVRDDVTPEPEPQAEPKTAKMPRRKVTS